MFQKFLCTFSMMLFLLTIGQGQASLIVEGYVRFGDSFEPAPEYMVWIQSPVVENGADILLRTNENGYYRLETNTALDSLMGLDSIFVTVKIFDLCTGETYRGTFELRPDVTWVFTFDAFICQGIDPPPPPISCEAFFSYEQISFDSLLVAFTDLSFSADSIFYHFWDFGDGNHSENESPVHQYQEPGIYPVSLLIEADSCTNIFTMEVYVSDTEDCICTTEYNPVCVVDSAGVQMRFSNPCLARCAGYDENSFVRCEDGGGCECPEYYDPVCVVVGQDTLSFPNHCFAECEGFLPHQFVSCYPDSIGPCGCIAIYEPVCILTDNGEVLSFPNKCEAECAGYQEAQMVDCNGVEYCQAAFFVEQPDPNERTYIFMDNSRALNDHIIRWQWNFGDGEEAEEPAPLHTYREAGSYLVELTISTERGCHSKTFIPLQVGLDSTCICPDIYEPVCVLIDSIFVASFPNACEANCAGFSDFQLISCDPDEGCPEIYAPVCVFLPDGTIVEFPNACEAEREGFGPNDWTECEPDCVCPTIYDPVCVVLPDGTIREFSNRCELECAGLGSFPIFDCESNPVCDCADVFSPVCVLTDEGFIQSFTNACYAECAGFDPGQFIDCNAPWPCDCPFELDPVCVVNDEGVVITLPNPCVAECRGYPAETWVNCEEQGCFANFEINSDPNRPLNVVFSDASRSTEGEIIYYSWDLNDSLFAEGPTVEITFPGAGVWKVGLNIMTADSCQARIVRRVLVGDDTTVAGPDCQAMFFFQQDSIERSMFQFIDLSVGEAVAWSWDFGDGQYSTEPNPLHRYEEAGVYLVRLTIRGDHCTSTAEMIVHTADNVTYDNDCRSLFLPFLDEETNGVFFLNLSTPVAVYSWEFGDGTSGNQYHALHLYEEAGIYEVKLTVTTSDSCVSHFSATIDLANLDFRAAPEFFSISATDDPLPELGEVVLYPNPVRERLQLQFEAFATEDLEWQIISLDGVVLKRNRLRSSLGENQERVDVSQLPPGMYFLRLSSLKGSQTFRFVKQ